MPCSKRPTCRRGCLHRELINDYRLERYRQETAAENASKGHATEMAEYLEQHPLITFKSWLIARRRMAVAA